VLGERRPALLAETSQHVEHAAWQELLTDLGHQKNSERSILCRLEHNRVARTQRRSDLQRRQQHRRIPRDDRTDDADRLAPRIAQHLLAERDRLALQLSGQATKIAEDIGRQPRFGPRLRSQGVAGLERNGAGHFLAAGLQSVGDAQQQAAAVARSDLAPGREGPRGSRHGAVHIGRIAARNLGDRSPLGGVFHAQRRT